MTENKVMICLFLDIKDAYNAVNLTLLREKLIYIGLSQKLSAGIVNLFTNRKLILRNNNNALTGPRLSSTGIPQD